MLTEDHVQAFVNFLEPFNYAINTRRRYAYHFRKYLAKYGSFEVNREVLFSFLTDAKNSSHARAFVKVLLDFLSFIYPSLEDDFDKLRNRLPEPRGRTPKKFLRYLKHQEVERLAEAADRIDIQLMIWLSFFGCLRASELIGDGREYLGLRKRDIDLNNNWFKIRGKGQKERLAFFIPELKEYIRVYTELLKDDDRLFPMTIQRWDRILNKLGLMLFPDKRISSHWLRRSGAMYLIHEKGWDILKVKDYGGWENLETLKHYAEATPEILKESWDKMFPVSS